MTGMVLLLIGAAWVGETGWQSTQTPAPTGGSRVQPVVATEPWAGAPTATTTLDPAALQRAEQSVRQGIDRFSDAARELTSVPPLPAGTTSAVWREVEGALLQPAQRSATPVSGDSRSFGAAGHLRVANYADQPPQPPADPYAATYSGAPSYGAPVGGAPVGNAPAYGPPTYGTAPGTANYGNPPGNAGWAGSAANLPPSLPRDVPVERGNVRGWLEQESAGVPVSSNRPRVGLPPGRDAFPEEEEAAWARNNSRGTSPASSRTQGRWASDRGDGYEERVAVNPRPDRRYLDPPERGDDEPRSGSAGRLRQDREESAARDRLSDRGDDRDDDRYAEDRPRRANGRVVPAVVEQQVEEAIERKPWWPLMLTLLGLFASGGFNVYLGWIAWDLYTRHVDMLEDVRELESRLEKQQAALDAGSMTSGRAARPTAMAG